MSKKTEVVVAGAGPVGLSAALALARAGVSVRIIDRLTSQAALKVHKDSEESLRSDVGFRSWYNFEVGGTGLRPFVRAAWEHEYKESALPVTASLEDIPTSPVTVFGPSLGHNSAVVNAGVSVQWTPTISTYVSYDGQLGRARYDSNGVSGGFRISF